MISLCLPSRGRPDNACRFIESAVNASSGPIQVILRVDDDDPFVCEYEGLESRYKIYVDVIVEVGPRIILSECSNECARLANGDILAYMGDDIVFRTFAWDLLVKQAFVKYEDSIALVYGQDGIQNESMATHGFVTRKWVETLGYLVPPYFVSDYADTWLTEVAMKLGRLHYIPRLYTEHMHYLNGKGPLDKTHQERLDRAAKANTAKLYADLAPKRAEDVEKLRKVIRP